MSDATTDPGPQNRTIEVSAVVIRDGAGRVLNVRKRGTRALMLPGGKPESAEDPRDTAIREFREELGIDLDPLQLRGLGTFITDAANEPGHRLVAHVFEHPYVAVSRPMAEIDHLEWVDPGADAGPIPQAPLNTEHVYPELVRRDVDGALPQRITVFTGSSSGASPRFAEIASDFGAALAEQGIGLVYGGGHVGLMGVVADATRQGGSEVVGVIPQGLVDRELAHPNIDRIEVVADMHERKHRMAALGDAFVALPGGPGTLEEFFEALTWMQLGIHNRPVALLNSGGFWDAQLRMLDDMVEHGFMAREFRERIVVAETPAGLFASLREWRPPRAKWQK
ncbi:hypothetical protein GCM10009847_17370 [Leucobacter tardus]|uniref:TIGR00730 family Rossman fold protein n=1 Tax=Leucobacter tardus TaxID=501483 RepID=UPI0027DDC911|nr:TIGR00730 family Rossman fold protein [Leucobacter tardus]